jgi:hypothetical protein
MKTVTRLQKNETIEVKIGSVDSEASQIPQSRKIPVFDCSVALCTMKNESLVISNLT